MYKMLSVFFLNSTLILTALINMFRNAFSVKKYFYLKKKKNTSAIRDCQRTKAIMMTFFVYNKLTRKVNLCIKIDKKRK